MRKRKRNINDLTALVGEAQLEKLASIVVYDTPDGGYSLFDKYKLLSGDQTVTVIRQSDDSVRVFSSSKIGVAWATFDHRNMIYEASRVEFLDNKICSLNADIANQTKIAKKHTDIDKLIHLAKLTEAKQKRDYLQGEMNGYVLNVKNWQHRQFTKK
jgi:hypothetical protein